MTDTILSITSTITSGINNIWSIFSRFIKPKVLITVTTEIYDHSKGFDTFTNPANQLRLSFVNRSHSPLTIREVQFCYRDNGPENQAQLVYNNFSHAARDLVKNKTLTQSQEASIILRYTNPEERKVIEQLQSITLVSTYGHEYTISKRKLCKEISNLLKQVKDQ